MEYVEVVDEINREVSKLNAVALLIAGQSEVMEGATNIILDSADSIKSLVRKYGVESKLID